jgi:hypothetical protein
MIKIEESAIEMYPERCDEIHVSERDAFIHGVEFAQRWIAVDEELPPNELYIIVKNKYKYGVMRMAGVIDLNFLKANFTHWRPIELK